MAEWKFILIRQFIGLGIIIAFQFGSEAISRIIQARIDWQSWPIFWRSRLLIGPLALFLQGWWAMRWPFDPAYPAPRNFTIGALILASVIVTWMAAVFWRQYNWTKHMGA